MKIVYLTSRFPFPLEKGDKLRAFQQIKILASQGHQIHLFSITDRTVEQNHLDAVSPYCSSITINPISKFVIFTNIINAYLFFKPIQSLYFYDSNFHERLIKEVGQINPDVIFFQLVRTAAYAKGLEMFPSILDFQDAFSKGMQQRAIKGSFLKRFVFGREARLLLEFERTCLHLFDAFSIICDTDKKELDPGNDAPIKIIPNAVDTGYFTPKSNTVKNDLLFVGNMGYKPNEEAARFLVKEIMPLVWKKRPATTLVLAGANPSKIVKSLASELVQVTGWVDDIRACYETSQVFVAPMVSGTGLQNKLLEALSMGLPSITTPICAASLAPNYEDIVRIADTPSALADGIIEMLQSQIEKEQFRKLCLPYIMENYNSTNIGLQLEQLFKKAIINHSMYKKRKS